MILGLYYTHSHDARYARCAWKVVDTRDTERLLSNAPPYNITAPCINSLREYEINIYIYIIGKMSNKTNLPHTFFNK